MFCMLKLTSTRCTSGGTLSTRMSNGRRSAAAKRMRLPSGRVQPSAGRHSAGAAAGGGVLRGLPLPHGEMGAAQQQEHGEGEQDFGAGRKRNRHIKAT